jgi:HK97 family phage major capsid protein
MTVYLDRLLDERTSLTGVMTGLRDRAAAEERDITEAERSEITRLQERCVEIDSLLTEHQAQAESARSFADLQARIEAQRERTAGRSPEQRTPGSQMETTSPGLAFVESEQFRAYPGRGQGQAFQVTDWPLQLETRALITTANLAIPHVVIAPREQVTPVSPLLEVVDTQRVSGGVAEWVEVGPDPVAAIVAEGSAKPEAVITFTPRTAALDTIAHWVQITRQALADAAYVRGLVETKLRRGVLRKIEEEVAAALAAAALPTATGATLLGAIRAGVGTVQAAGYTPNAVVLNPADWADLDVTVMGGTLGGPTVGQTFWGLRPVAVPSQPAGTATVGDFQSGVSWLDRGVTDVFVTDSHAAFFISNILVILAEARGKAVVPEPNALCECAATVIP